MTKANADLPRDLGPQPIGAVMAEHGLRPRDVVAASTEQITHKMVQRACKGRRLSPHVMAKVRNALNAAASTDYALSQLFTYPAGAPSRRERAAGTRDTPDPSQ